MARHRPHPWTRWATTARARSLASPPWTSSCRDSGVGWSSIALFLAFNVILSQEWPSRKRPEPLPGGESPDSRFAVGVDGRSHVAGRFGIGGTTDVAVMAGA